MTDYGMAWLIGAGAGLLALIFWCLLTRSIRSRFVKALLRGVAAVWMLVPAPVPGYSGEYAPAYVVALFETVFQSAGEPRVAFFILGGATLLVVALLTAWALYGGFKDRPADAQPTVPSSQ